MAGSQRLALLSVTDKRGVVELGRALAARGYELLSTGGTARTLREAGLSVRDAAEHTSSPEILGGRVKTLHPRIHGGILFDRDDFAHQQEALAHDIAPIDIVVVNLYRFAEEAVAKELSATDAIHHIDIGGPAMLRAAAKNWRHCLPLCDPDDYARVLAALDAADGPSLELRRGLAAKVFAKVAAYDQMISSYLSAMTDTAAAAAAAAAAEKAPSQESMPAQLNLKLSRVIPLRYGENPHQAAGLYAATADDAADDHGEKSGLVGFARPDIIQGKELSYNNIQDLDAACRLAADLSAPSCVIVKHTNPCGVAMGDEPPAELFRKALACDSKSAFGGILAFNVPLDGPTAKAITAIFIECVAAPEVLPEARVILATKPNLRVVRAPFAAAQTAKGAAARPLVMRSVLGALLVQQDDTLCPRREQFKAVTERLPDEKELGDLEFAMTVAKHVKSNAIVFAKDGVTLGVGAGQMSRIDAARLAAQKANEAGFTLKGSALASDAFLPFRDTVDFAADHGVTMLVQPGGSLRDQDSIDAANQHAIAMVFTGERHFRH